MKRQTLVIVLLLAAACAAFGATSAALRSVEMDVVIRTDGKAELFESLD